MLFSVPLFQEKMKKRRLRFVDTRNCDLDETAAAVLPSPIYFNHEVARDDKKRVFVKLHRVACASRGIFACANARCRD